MEVFKRLKGMLPVGGTAAPRAPISPAPEISLPTWPFSPADFDRLGKTGETIGERMVAISSRLTDLQALREEFVSFSAPVHEFIESHAQAQARLAETEALLLRARNENDSIRLEVIELRRAADDMRNEIAEMREARRHVDDAAEEREHQLKAAKSAADESQSTLEWVQRQLASEIDKAKTHSQTNRRLAGEIERLELHLKEERGRSVKLQDAGTLADGEIAQLRETMERLQPLYTTSKRRLIEAEAELNSHKQAIAGLETKLGNEREGRLNAEELREQERVASESELAFSVTQFEALSSRHETTARLLEQARALVAQKSEETRLADRALNDAVSERAAAERRVAAVQEETRRLSTQLANADELLQDTKSRCAMLTKALAAKDTLIAQQTAKSDNLAQQNEATALRFEQDRAERESAHRKLIEELERERAERALAQGALSIARASREKLIEQLEAAKRKKPSAFHDEIGPNETVGESESKIAGNVHAFRSQESALDK